MSDGFLSRWARRKRDVRLGERTETPAADMQGVEAGAVPGDDVVVPEAAATEAEIDLLAELPSLADLTAETDLLPFLRAGVPAALRNAALRKMWSVDPAIRDFVSEAREYAYDWNTPGGVPGLGPLLPGDDVKAMLGRLFNRDPSEPLATDTSRVDPAPQADADSETCESVASEGQPVFEASDEPDEPKLLAKPMDHHAPANSPEQASATSISTVSVSRLRRHGGAMPS